MIAYARYTWRITTLDTLTNPEWRAWHEMRTSGPTPDSPFFHSNFVPTVQASGWNVHMLMTLGIQRIDLGCGRDECTRRAITGYSTVSKGVISTNPVPRAVSTAGRRMVTAVKPNRIGPGLIAAIQRMWDRQRAGTARALASDNESRTCER